jgi:ferric-dicitrate binding protein FerR (iron transport regulator)
MTYREKAAFLRKLADEIEALEPVDLSARPPTAREVAEGLLREYGAWQARMRQTGVTTALSAELQAYVERNPPELQALRGGHPNPMDLYRDEAEPTPPPPEPAPQVQPPAPPKRRWFTH